MRLMCELTSETVLNSLINKGDTYIQYVMLNAIMVIVKSLPGINNRTYQTCYHLQLQNNSII